MTPDSRDWRRAGRLICHLLAATWFLTGLLYTWAGVTAPVTFDVAGLAPERIGETFATLRTGASIYVAAFVAFGLADFSLLLLAPVLRELGGRGDFRSQLVCVSVVVAMLIGILVDVLLLSHWLIVWQWSSRLGPDALVALWIAMLEVQMLGVWLSVASFLIGGGALVLLARIVGSRPEMHPWARMTNVVALLLFLEVAAIIFDVVTNSNGILTAVFFLLITNAIAPLWALWLARVLARRDA